MDPSDPSPPETLLLVRRSQAGDREALDRLMSRFYGRVERIVRVRLGSGLRARVDVGDVVQQTMLRAIQGLDQFEIRADAHLIHWLSRLAENEIASLAAHHRAAKRDLDREAHIDDLQGPSADETHAWDIVADSVSVPSKVARRELEQIVDQCLGELREDQREVILLKDYARADWDYIAENLEKVSVGAAQQLYQRARLALAEKVKTRI